MASNALPPRGTAVLLALLLAMLVFQLGRAPLLGPDEPRYARVAVEMARRGDLVTPTLGGQPWLEKPALYYWLAGAAFRVLGETETAARLPSVAGALLLVGATALVGARLYGGAAGLRAALDVRRPLTEERAHVETVARVRAIDEDAFQTAYAEGSCASLDQIVDRARSHGGQA